jgi:tyrosine-protein phosphatase non-receptor type 9
MFCFQAVKQFIDLIHHSTTSTTNPNRKNITPSIALKFLLARKFDIRRAVALYEQNELIRTKEGLHNFDPMTDPLRSELETGKFTILVSGHRYVDHKFATHNI